MKSKAILIAALTAAIAALMVLAVLIPFNSEIDLEGQKTGLQIESFQSVQDRQTGGTIVRIEGQGLGTGTSAWLLPSNSDHNAIITRMKTWGGASDIVVKGSRGYLANGRRGLLVVDLSRPDHPEVISSLPLPGTAIHVSVDDRFAYLSCGKGGLHIIDLADPQHPALAATLPMTAWKTLLIGPRAYVADNYAGLTVLDISDPGHPKFLTTLALPGSPLGVAGIGSKSLLVPLGKDGCALVDISDPTMPRLLGRPITDAFVWDAAAEGDLAFVALNRDASKGRVFGRAELYDCSDPGRLQLRGSVKLKSPPWRVSLLNGEALIALGDGGFSVVDIRHPEQPVETGYYASMENCRAVIRHGEAILAVDRRGALFIIDRKKLTKSLASSTFYNLIPPWEQLPGRSEALFLCRRPQSGAHLVAWDGTASPQIVAPVTTEGRLVALAVQNQMAAIALDLRQKDRTNDVLIIDHAEPAQPKILTTMRFVQPVNKLAWYGETLIVEENEDGNSSENEKGSRKFFWLKLYSLKDPKHPREIGKLRLAGLQTDLVVHGHQLIVNARNAKSHELLFIDLVEPRQLEVVGRLALPPLLSPFFSLHDMVVEGRTAFVAGGRAGLLKVDLSEPDSPRLIATLDLGGLMRSVKLDGSLVFAGVDDLGVVVIDIEKADVPRVVGRYSYTSGPIDHFLLPDRLLVGRGSFDTSRSYRRPLRLQQNGSVSDWHLEVRIPKELDPGDYSVWISRDHELAEIPGVVSRGSL